MNHRGQLAMLGIMLAAMTFIMIVALINPLREQVTTARDANHLNCANTTLTAGEQGTCIMVDWFMPGFIGTAITVAIAFIGLTKIKNKQE